MNPDYQQATYERPAPPPMPDNHLVWAILSTIFCCLPFGVVSIVYAAQVESLYLQGRYEEAVDKSKKAFKWAIASAATVAAIMMLYVLILLIITILGLK
ncbi:hypothetical protein HMPREF9332_00874 [Alloprevotella rava F0323]|uniref:Interferon-induced transmembrane protein n=1 Tax=Alloprevotella rava F0323 TaxID=679199 RepID=G5GBC3_9BACT|nr:CD225/dispanin family protein [Alloprevotella rava]EHG23122.1 hypothetical protein HMPREF9332_00874 [Alloprevotella rava F0323]